MNNDPKKSGKASLRLTAVGPHGDATTEPEATPDTAEIQRLLHELQVHQIELEMQNSELLAARDAQRVLWTYADLYEFAPVGYLSLDGNGAIRSINRSGAELLGVDRSLLIGRNFRRFVAEEERIVFTAFLDSLAKGSVKETCDVTILALDSPIFVRLMAKVSPSGEECRVVLIDITEQKKAEKLLQASRSLFRTLAQVAPVGIFRTGPRGEYFYVNERWLEISGISG